MSRRESFFHELSESHIDGFQVRPIEYPICKKKNLCIYLHEVIELQVDGHHEEGLVVLLLEDGVDPVSLRQGELDGGLGALVRIAGRVVRDDIAEGSQVAALQAREGVGLKERVYQFYSFVYVEILR